MRQGDGNRNSGMVDIIGVTRGHFTDRHDENDAFFYADNVHVKHKVNHDCCRNVVPQGGGELAD